MNKQNLVPLSEAARRLGLTRQTLSNWLDRGIIPVVLTVGKTKYTSEAVVSALTVPTEKIQESLVEIERLRAEIDKDKEHERLALFDRKTYRYYVNLATELSLRSGFFRTAIQFMSSQDLLTEREAEALICRLNGETLEEISEKFGFTRERCRQLAEKALRKSSDIQPILDKLHLLHEKELEISSLKHECSRLRALLKHEGHIDNLQISDSAVIKLCETFSKRLTEFSLSVRALNCLKAADIDTVGDLCKTSETSLLKLRAFGVRTLSELREFLAELGLSFEMEVERYYARRAEILK